MRGKGELLLIRFTRRHIRQLAESHNVPMPILDVAHQHMLSARAHGGDELDWTALVGGQRIAAGLHPFKGRVSIYPAEMSGKS